MLRQISVDHYSRSNLERWTPPTPPRAPRNSVRRRREVPPAPFSHQVSRDPFGVPPLRPADRVTIVSLLSQYGLILFESGDYPASSVRLPASLARALRWNVALVRILLKVSGNRVIHGRPGHRAPGSGTACRTCSRGSCGVPRVRGPAGAGALVRNAARQCCAEFSGKRRKSMTRSLRARSRSQCGGWTC